MLQKYNKFSTQPNNHTKNCDFMENLVFKIDGERFVTDALTAGEAGTIAFQLNYEVAGANVAVEYTLDPAMGWKAADQKTASLVHADIIVGVIDGVSVRVVTDHRPTEAKYHKL